MRGDDELARLATSFNEMVGKIAEREQRITQLAFNDVLTGLPNRTMFQQQLEHLFRASEGNGSLFALHCLDLDQFKVINDTLGHPAGDTLLDRGRAARAAGGARSFRRAAGRRRVRRPPDRRRATATRSTGSPATSSKPWPSRWSIDGNELVPSTSIGIAIAPHDGSDGETLLRNADLALYRAKEAGRGTFAFFEESLNERAQERRQLETDLRLAVERDEFELYYQPLFDLEQNRICSFEALIRWNHPTRGQISPADFIPVAEDTGLIVPIGAWVIREACAQAAHWPEHIRVAVNVSPVQFHRGALNETILRALADSGLAPARLEVEITESIFLEGSEATLRLLHSLRSLGVRVALDDFGTGYSSLSYLQSFPFDKLKIDRSFIQNLLTRDGASAIVRAITELAHALNIETTAEGVEETAQLMELARPRLLVGPGLPVRRADDRGDVDQLFRDDKTVASERRLIAARSRIASSISRDRWCSRSAPSRPASRHRSASAHARRPLRRARRAHRPRRGPAARSRRRARASAPRRGPSGRRRRPGPACVPPIASAIARQGARARQRLRRAGARHGWTRRSRRRRWQRPRARRRDRGCP